MNNRMAVDLMADAVNLSKLTSKSLSGYFIGKTVASLARLGIEATRNAERLCSDPTYDQERFDRKVNTISRRVFQALADMGIECTRAKVEIHGDPRGSCLQIEIATGLSSMPMRFRF